MDVDLTNIKKKFAAKMESTPSSLRSKFISVLDENPEDPSMDLYSGTMDDVIPDNVNPEGLKPKPVADADLAAIRDLVDELLVYKQDIQLMTKNLVEPTADTALLSRIGQLHKDPEFGDLFKKIPRHIEKATSSLNDIIGVIDLVASMAGPNYHMRKAAEKKSL